MELLKKFLETEEFRSLQQDFPELDKEAFTKPQDNWLLSAITQSSIEVESNSIDLFREDFGDDVMKKVLGEILVKAQELLKS